MSTAVKDSSYFIPAPSKWPAVGSVSMILTLFGAAGLVNAVPNSHFVLIAGLLVLVYMFFGWFGQVASESEKGEYGAKVDASFRWSMGWFIFSEVMFFAAFFGALFYIRTFSISWLGGEGDKGLAGELLWPEFEATWPPMITPEESLMGDQAVTKGPDESMYLHSIGNLGTWLPLYNTIVLLTSSGTVHFAHMALKENNRKRFNFWLGITVLLAFIFVILQALEYYEAYAHLGLTLNTGVYGTTFFMLTGFHGMHVLIGGIFLATQLTRSAGYNHFTDKEHFGFEAASWYWHFVDVVWVCLFLFVYIL